MRGPILEGATFTPEEPRGALALACVTVPLSLSSPLPDGGEGESLLRAQCSLIHSAAGLLLLPLLLLGVPAQPGSRGPSQGGVFLPHGPLSLPQKGLGPDPALTPRALFQGPVLRAWALLVGGRACVQVKAVPIPGSSCQGRGLGPRNTPCNTPTAASRERSDTYRVSGVPWLPAVSSITHRALNDKDNSKNGPPGAGDA